MKVLILSFLVLSASAFGAEKKIAAAAISKTSAAPKTSEIDSKTASEEITDSTATLSNINRIVAHVIC